MSTSFDQLEQTFIWRSKSTDDPDRLDLPERDT
jgi:hypothetical protein